MPSNSGLKTLHALVSMMDEPDEAIYSSLKKKVLSFNENAVPVLEQAWMAANNLLVVSRLEELMEEINLKLVHNRMEHWLSNETGELHKVLTIVNKLHNKDLDEDKLNQAVDLLFKDAWLEMNENLTALEKIKVLNHIFFKVHRFNTSPANNDNLSDFFVSHLMESKEGNPSSMGLLYLATAQYLKLPVYGVNLPGHLILAFIDDRHRINEESNYTRDDILFYINPFNGGAVFTENEIELYISQVKLKNEPNYFLPTNNRSIILRYLKELHLAYTRDNSKQKADYVSKLLKLF